MANPEHVTVLKQGVAAWNAWRIKYPDIQPDLQGADLSIVNLSRADLSEVYLFQANLHQADLRGANLHEADLRRADLGGADLRGTNLSGAKLSRASLFQANLHEADLRIADLSGANLFQADLRGTNLFQADLRGADLRTANLSRADLSRAYLFQADLRGADLHQANLRGANLFQADLRGANFFQADLRGANLRLANLVEANLTKADLTGCYLYGVSAWNVRLAGAIQKNLVIALENEAAIQVDDLEIAQFIYLLLNNAKIRRVIDTITSKVVLILGRFIEERKAVLDALRTALRQHDYLPVLFDLKGPSDRDITETVSTLAHMARFVIADMTDAKSILQELIAIVPTLPSVPVQPVLLESQREYGMFEHFKRYPWVLPLALYGGQEELLSSLEQRVILPAEAKVREIRAKASNS
jgi:uncharacterized protein YjbI with pentapeptide repeats